MADCRIWKSVVLDMLDDIDCELKEGNGFDHRKWCDYVSHYETETADWLYKEDSSDFGASAWVCSNCLKKNDMIPTHIQYPTCVKRVIDPYAWAGSNYCPNCGRKMRRQSDMSVLKRESERC